MEMALMRWSLQNACTVIAVFDTPVAIIDTSVRWYALLFGFFIGTIIFDLLTDL